MRIHTPSTVMSALALLVALGGASYAAVSVGSAEIKNNSVASKDIKNNGVTTKDVKNGSLAVEDLNPSVPSSWLAPGSPAGGDLAGTYPSPRLAPDGPPVDVAANPNATTDPCTPPVQSLVLCGTSTARWVNGGYGVPGVQVWKDRRGYVHVRGSVTRSSTSLNAPFLLPPELSPRRLFAQVVALGGSGAAEGGTALLIVSPDGGVGLFQQTGAFPIVHLGELVFRADA